MSAAKRSNEPTATTKLWRKTLRKLALLRALTDESAISIVDRLVDQELARIQAESKGKAQ